MLFVAKNVQALEIISENTVNKEPWHTEDSSSSLCCQMAKFLSP